ncbi:MAG: Jag N-terminal domain-containing protein [Desulfovibrionaceae bacterium]|jgi:spoIIIJ-associated protein|nr:Jag N-terminal domain-containing protein [Desulfovibrionaceae bacterium]
MPEYIEFEGKSIDAAIEAACAHFDAPREKLEIEILNESKSGIFGFVGAKKARVQARLADTESELLGLCTSVLTRLVEPIIGPFELRMEVEEGRVRASIDAGEAAGLLIGREGQTLASVQYLANRVLAKRWPEPVRLHVDIGDYRERQEDTLVQTALDLAERAKAQGRALSTRPLSSYHRRLVHLALQADEEISTRSKGDGPMKRVIIVPRNGRTGGDGRTGSGRSGGNGRGGRAGGRSGGRTRRPRKPAEDGRES